LAKSWFNEIRKFQQFHGDFHSNFCSNRVDLRHPKLPLTESAPGDQFGMQEVGDRRVALPFCLPRMKIAPVNG
jgi:hypothetical protein